MSSSNLSKATKNQCKSALDLCSIAKDTSSPESNNQQVPKVPCADQTNTTSSPKPPKSKPSNSPKESHHSKGQFIKNIKTELISIFSSSKLSPNSRHQNSPRTDETEEWLDVGSKKESPKIQSTLSPFFQNHTVGPSAGSKISEMIEKEKTNTASNGYLAEVPQQQQTSKPTTPESDSIRRNFNSNGNFLAQTTTPPSMADSNQNNNPVFNYNMKVAAINLKILPSSQSSNYYIDKETHADIQQKLSLLTPEERIEMQKISYNLLKSNFEKKSVQSRHLDEEIKELNQKLLDRNQTIRSQFEIDHLRNEIRNLTNEKAELELEISRRAAWNCTKCTYRNKNEDVQCLICDNERDVAEIYICKNCNTKNSMINVKCTKCSVNLGSENLEHQQQLAASASSDSHYQLTPHHNSHLYKTQASMTSTGSSGGSASSLSNSQTHGYPHQQYYQQQFSNQSNGGERSRNASSTSLNNHNNDSSGACGSNPNLSHPKLTHRPPPPIPSQQQAANNVAQSRPLHHPQVSSAPIFGQPSIPFVPGIGVVGAQSMTPQPSTNNRSPFSSHNHNNSSSNSSPNFGAPHR